MEQIRRVSNKYIDRSIWMSAVLAHQGSLTTSLSYSNVIIVFKTIDDRLFATPPEHMIRLQSAEIEELKRQMAELTKLVYTERLVAPLEIHDSQQVAFDLNDGVKLLNKHRKRNFDTTEDRDETIRHHISKLEEAGVPNPTSLKTLGRLGFGKTTVADFKRGRPLKKKPRVDERLADPENFEEAENTVLPPGTKVIVPNHGTENAQNMALARDSERFGRENLVLAGECPPANVVEKQKIKTHKGSSVTRDLCVK